MTRSILVGALGMALAAASANAQSCTLGEVALWGGNFAPRTWAFANGQLLPIAQNTALFSILGCTYGGDCRTTFALPNLQSRSVTSVGNGPGLVSRPREGATMGSTTVTLTNLTMPSHRHVVTASGPLKASSDEPESDSPAGRVLAKGEDDAFASGGTPTAMGTATVSTATFAAQGGSQPQNIRSPGYGLYHIICLQGTFPSRN